MPESLAQIVSSATTGLGKYRRNVKHSGSPSWNGTLKASLSDSGCGGDGVGWPSLQRAHHLCETDRYKFIQIEEVAEDGSEGKADYQDMAVSRNHCFWLNLFWVEQIRILELSRLDFHSWSWQGVLTWPPKSLYYIYCINILHILLYIFYKSKDLYFQGNSFLFILQILTEHLYAQLSSPLRTYLLDLEVLTEFTTWSIPLEKPTLGTSVSQSSVSAGKKPLGEDALGWNI